MKKYTLKDLETSPRTLVKFFVLQGQAKASMFKDAYEFYITFSNHKSRKMMSKGFTKIFFDALDFYNSIKK